MRNNRNEITKKKITKFLLLNKTLEIIPGKTIRKRGKNFKALAKTQPARACVKFFAANTRCTIT